MRIYLYGLILNRNAHLVPAHITGIRGATLTVKPCGEIAALVSAVETSNYKDLNAVRSHDHAVQAVVHHGATTSAVRFGQTFRDEEELLEHVGERATQIGDVLRRLDGHVEMRVLMTLPPDETPGTTTQSPGRAYLESLRGSTRVSGLALRGALGPVVRAERVEELPKASGVAFAHLIRRADETEYRDAIAAHPSLADAKVVGPLALYTFAEVVE